MVFCVAVIAFIIALVKYRPDPKYPSWGITIAASFVVACVATIVSLLVVLIPALDIEKNGEWETIGGETVYTVAEGSQVTRTNGKISFIAETDSGLEPVELDTKENTYLEVRRSDVPESRVTVSTEERSWGYWLTPWESFAVRTVIQLEN